MCGVRHRTMLFWRQSTKFNMKYLLGFASVRTFELILAPIKKLKEIRDSVGVEGLQLLASGSKSCPAIPVDENDVHQELVWKENVHKEQR